MVVYESSGERAISGNLSQFALFTPTAQPITNHSPLPVADDMIGKPALFRQLISKQTFHFTAKHMEFQGMPWM